MKLGWVSIVILVGCGGAPFELGAVVTSTDGELPGADAGGPLGDPDPDAGVDTSDAGASSTPDAAPDARKLGSPRDGMADVAVDAGDAQVVDAPSDVSAMTPDAAPDAPPDVVVGSKGLCCNRPSGGAYCSETPWFCCQGTTCGGSAACAAFNADGGLACVNIGYGCGLQGGPISGTVGPCP